IIEIRLFITAAVLHGPTPTDGELMIPHHVQHAHLRYGDFEELRALRHTGADKQSPVTAATDSQFFAAGIFLFDQKLGCGNKVDKHVLLIFEHTGLMPGFSVLASAAEVNQTVNPSVFDKRQI